MLVYGDSTVLPASFRYPSSRRLRHGRLIDVTGEFARVPARMRPRRRLRGTFYHLDPSNPGHFGHVLTESVSRLWGWDEAKAAFPDLKVLFRLRRADQPTTLERTLYTAYGIAPDDIVWADEPVWLSSLVTATPMWQNEDPHYVHPGIEQVWRRLRSLAGPTAGRPRRTLSVADQHCSTGRVATQLPWKRCLRVTASPSCTPRTSISPSRPPCSPRPRWWPDSGDRRSTTSCTARVCRP